MCIVQERNYWDAKNGFKISVHSRILVSSHDFHCLMKNKQNNDDKSYVIGVPSNLQDIPSLADIHHIIFGFFKISFASFSSVERSNIFNHLKTQNENWKRYWYGSCKCLTWHLILPLAENEVEIYGVISVICILWIILWIYYAELISYITYQNSIPCKCVAISCKFSFLEKNNCSSLC